MIPLFDMPTTQRAVDWIFWRGFLRKCEGLLNRLQPVNFKALAAIPLAKRANQYATYQLSHEQNVANANPINGQTARYIRFTASEDGAVIGFYLECLRNFSSGSLELELYKNGVAVTALEITSAVKAVAWETGSSFVSGDTYEVRLSKGPAANNSIEWEVSLLVKEKITTGT